MARSQATIHCQPWNRMKGLACVVLICLWVPSAAVAATSNRQLRGPLATAPERSNNILRQLSTDVEDFPCPESNNCMLGEIQGQRIHRNYFFGMFCQAKCELVIFPLLLPKINNDIYKCGECPSSSSDTSPSISNVTSAPSTSFSPAMTVSVSYYFEP
jgi:hypothetical protein